MAQKTQRRSTKWKFIVLLLVVCLACVGWSGAWFYLRSALVGSVATKTNALASRDMHVSCPGLSVLGFPFRFETSCESLVVADQDRRFFQIDDLTSVSLVYNPTHIIFQSSGPASYADRANGWLTETEWSKAEASVRLSLAGVSQLDAELEAPSVMLSSSLGDYAAMSEQLQVHLRRPPDAFGDLETFIDASSLVIEDVLNDWDELGARFHTVISQGGDLLSGRSLDDIKTLQGGVLRVQIVSASFGSAEESIHLRGEISIDQNDLVSGDLTVGLSGIDGLAERARKLWPNDRELIKTIRDFAPLLGRNTVASGRGQRLEFPMTIRKGVVSVGFVTLGELQPIRF
ncbi:MAG: DUF2125 domain-containing protein [Rhodobacteraceae bacterium]|nr:DUF2125 domain-containing protein [Paracoccaceae bacterium]